jgi:hypothetical protein
MVACPKTSGPLAGGLGFALASVARWISGGFVERKLWAIDRAEEFWAARRDLLAEAFNDFLRDSFPTRRLGSG